MRILILGSTGMLGHMACRVFREEHEVYATSRALVTRNSRCKDVFANVHLLEDVDGRDEGRIRQVFSECRPQIALNCVGVVKQMKEGNDPLVAIPVNSLILHVAKALVGKRGTDIKKIGIRPGEKIHEVLIGEDEIHRTSQIGDYYAIASLLPEIGNRSRGAQALTTEYSSADHVMDLEETIHFLRANRLMVEDVDWKDDELLR